MKLQEKWEQLASIPQTPQQQQAFWDDYFATETTVYEKILSDTSIKYEGKVADLAAQFEIEPTVFFGFLDGINTSLKTELAVADLDEESEVSLDIDFEKLFFNMNDAKAKWLYTLPQWDDILTKERRDEITREWRASKQAVSEKTVGRNDPCPCGSGKKYKKCCGKAG
ncbi:MAG: SEC-C metal-binding domain-containing protein [Christensenellaceae bacterium]|jgi:malate synthase